MDSRATASTATVAAAQAPRRPLWRSKTAWRLAALACFLVGLVILGSQSGLTENLNPDSLRGLLASAGVCGILLFFGAFAAGNLLQVPGMLFVTVGVLGYGQWAGGGLALIGAVLAVTMTFIVVRTIGGKPLAKVKRPIVRRLLSQLDDRPVRTIVILRTFFQTSPALNYALALSRVRFRDYVIGSAFGLVLPVIVVMMIAEATGI